MKIIRYTRAIVCTALPMCAMAPEASAEVWTLDSCVNYAVDHNITLRQQQLRTASGELDVTSAKDAFLPTLSASASESFSFGRGLTTDNTYVDRNTSNFQWGVNLNVPLFQGLENVRRLKVAKSTLEQTLLEYEAAKDDLTLNIITQYLQVLYSREVEAASRSQLAYSEYEVERQESLVNAGKVPEADLLDAQAQRARDRQQLVASTADVTTQLITLANLLQLPSADDFDVAPLGDSSLLLPSAETVITDASARNSALLAARQGIRVADDNISLAKSGWLPRLSFTAGTGSSYYTVGGMHNESFGAQMRHNFSTYLGFQLSVPIFDAFSTRNNVRRARLQRLEAELEADRQESELFKTIRLAHTQAVGAREKYLASEETLEKTRMSFIATQEKYSLGRATPYEFEQAKTNLFQTEITRLQARYEYILRCRILRFYQKEPLL